MRHVSFVLPAAWSRCRSACSRSASRSANQASLRCRSAVRRRLQRSTNSRCDRPRSELLPKTRGDRSGGCTLRKEPAPRQQSGADGRPIRGTGGTARNHCGSEARPRSRRRWRRPIRRGRSRPEVFSRSACSTTAGLTASRQQVQATKVTMPRNAKRHQEGNHLVEPADDEEGDQKDAGESDLMAPGQVVPARLGCLHAGLRERGRLAEPEAQLRSGDKR